MSRTPVAVVGATGAVGQRFIQLLDGHPSFEATELVGRTSAGQRYRDAVHWVQDTELPEAVGELDVLSPDDDLDAPIVFSAIPGAAAGPVELDLAKQGKAVFTNARSHRMDPDVPLVVPDLNPDHIALVEGRSGFIVANPNCSVVVMTTPLKPLAETFGLEAVHVVTLQALSGAGYPGVASLDAVGNVVPYIGGEEDKIEAEPLKILGRREGGAIEHLDARISATATRVPVVEGHTCAVHVQLATHASPDAVAEALRNYRAPAEVEALPTAATPVIRVREEQDRPQPRRDVMEGGGMGVVVGRVRRDPLATVKFVVMGSNTIRGAAGCSVMNAELARSRRLI